MHIFVKSKNDMRTLIIGCIALMLYTINSEANANFPGKNWKSTISLESQVEADGISLTLNDDQVGVYHHFILEKSLDGKNFFSIAQVKGAGTSSQIKTYTSQDNDFNTNAYYRVKQTDFDGKFAYTQIVFLSLEK